MITTKDLYSSPKECCGCEACSQSCPKNIIKMQSAKDGFLYPIAINPSECINCKRCLKVCPLKHNYKGNPPIVNYGGYSVDEEDIKKSSSGGLATVLSRHFINDGGIVYGVVYTSDFKSVDYMRCNKLSDLDVLRGSKYAQSKKTNIYRNIQKDLQNKKVLFIGLPCVVHTVKLLFKNNLNLYTVALVCHGPTSQLVQREYIQALQKQYIGNLIDFTLRGKIDGWKPYYIQAKFDNGYEFREKFLSSTFGIAFAELKRPSCSNCKFKLNQKKSGIDSDLIIGDFHGAIPGKSYYNQWGVSQVSVLTIKGEEMVQMVDSSFKIIPVSTYQLIHYNKALGKSIKPRWNRNQFADKIANSGLEAACNLTSVKLIDFTKQFRTCIIKIIVKLIHTILRK